ATAIRYFEKALELTPPEFTGNAIVGLTSLGQARLAKGDRVAALQATTQASELHRANGFPKLDAVSSQDIWWVHSTALKANHKPKEAREALEMAYRFLLEGIANLHDAGLRRNYLNKVAGNRDIIQAWLKEGKKRKLSADRLTAHLAGESNLREPFQRLVDIGVRLNTLHATSELHEFIIEEATELSGAERVLLLLESETGLELAGAIVPRGEDAEALLPAIKENLAHVRRTRAANLVYTPESGEPLAQRSRFCAPLIAQNRVLGYLYADVDGPFGRLVESDCDLLAMFAGQAAVALDNAQWSEGLEHKVAERTAELNDRVGELAILNSVGEAMAKTLDVKTVTRIVGDRVRDIFNADVVSIKLLDPQSKLIHDFYTHDKGEGGYVEYLEPFP